MSETFEVSWNTLMIIKNVAILFLGMGLGMIILTIFFGYMFHRIKKVSDLSDISAMKLRCGESTHYFVNPDNIQESVESLLLLIYFFFHRGKHISAKDAKRTKRIIYTIFLIIIGAVIVLIFLSFGISAPPTTP